MSMRVEVKRVLASRRRKLQEQLERDLTWSEFFLESTKHIKV